MNAVRALSFAGFATGLIAAGAAAETTSLTPPAAPKSAVEREAAIELPPMIISESSKAAPWLYVAVDDTEYLSRCSATTTRAYVTAQLEIRRILHVFVPADFFGTSAVRSVSLLAPLETGSGTDDAVRRAHARNDEEPFRPDRARRSHLGT